ncbi:type II secretion system protein [Sulfurovum sp.]|uniref:type II secretion system protein n=1 Tax=Sulfurovum sp. TaxID=1969726 RepID=UPI002867EF06|nr:type II secretion system protein [Sulfurovum sp.]
MRHYRLTPAFSMLELIFVIVILGIVASIGSELIAKVYESYIVQRAQHNATLKTELAAAQIANRLASAIPGTVYRITNGNTYESIESNLGSPDGDNYKGLQWVGSDAESFNATDRPGWSGFCDINTSTQTNLSTPGSDLGMTNTIIAKLSNNTKNISNAAIYFPDDSIEHNISAGIGELLTLDGTGATRIVEHYKLAWSSYALVVENGDLFLYYNFDPTPAVALGATKSLLMKNVATFKFQGGGRTLRFKICKHERISEDVNITACKEKAVF